MKGPEEKTTLGWLTGINGRESRAFDTAIIRKLSLIKQNKSEKS